MELIYSPDRLGSKPRPPPIGLLFLWDKNGIRTHKKQCCRLLPYLSAILSLRYWNPEASGEPSTWGLIPHYAGLYHWATISVVEQIVPKSRENQYLRCFKPSHDSRIFGTTVPNINPVRIKVTRSLRKRWELNPHESLAPNGFQDRGHHQLACSSFTIDLKSICLVSNMSMNEKRHLFQDAFFK